jgi:hypothetical protein
MQFLSSDIIVVSSASLPEDDVDRLFKKLEQREPPVDIVKQILARVKQLPASQRYQSSPLQEDDRTDRSPGRQQRKATE